MIASSLLNEGYLQPAGDLSKSAVDGTAENPFLDNADAFYYFVSDDATFPLSLEWGLLWVGSRLISVYTCIPGRKRPTLQSCSMSLA